MPSDNSWGARQWAQNGSVRIAFDQFMPERDGDPLLVATGLGVNRWSMPDGFFRELAKQGFAVVRYDQRDGGESTHFPPTSTRNPITALLGKRGEAYTAENMADDAAAVLDALGWGSAHVLGVSLGGAVAQRVALRHPQRVRSLTTVAAVPGDVTGLRTLRFIRVRTLGKFAKLKFPDTREGAIEAGLAVAELLSSPRAAFDEKSVRARLEDNPDSGVHDQESQSRQIGAQWSGPTIDKIACPALIVHGEDDPLIDPKAARTIASKIPAARTLLLPAVGHDLPEHAWLRSLPRSANSPTRPRGIFLRSHSAVG